MDKFNVNYRHVRVKCIAPGPVHKCRRKDSSSTSQTSDVEVSTMEGPLFLVPSIAVPTAVFWDKEGGVEAGCYI
jgi:hypothetical protein